MSTAGHKHHLDRLISQLAPEQLDELVRVVEVMIDPVARAIANAPAEEDEITPAMAAELDAAHASRARGEGVSHEEIMRQFGLTPR